jgi:hypothetical protein
MHRESGADGGEGAPAVETAGSDNRTEIGVDLGAPVRPKQLVTLRKITEGRKARSLSLLVGSTSRRVRKTSSLSWASTKMASRRWRPSAWKGKGAPRLRGEHQQRHPVIRQRHPLATVLQERS